MAGRLLGAIPHGPGIWINISIENGWGHTGQTRQSNGVVAFIQPLVLWKFETAMPGGLS